MSYDMIHISLDKVDREEGGYVTDSQILHMDCIEGLCLPGSRVPYDEAKPRYKNACELICGYPTCKGRFWEKYPVG